MSLEGEISRSAQRKDADFRPGLRLSKGDVVVLAVGGICSLALWDMADLMSMSILFTLAHFFLFCNVLRMCRLYEMIWAVLFIFFASQTIAVNIPGWTDTVLIMLGVTATLSVLQLRQPSYHGILWQRINPDLPCWWAEHQAKARG